MHVVNAWPHPKQLPKRAHTCTPAVAHTIMCTAQQNTHTPESRRERWPQPCARATQRQVHTAVRNQMRKYTVVFSGQSGGAALCPHASGSAPLACQRVSAPRPSSGLAGAAAGRRRASCLQEGHHQSRGGHAVVAHSFLVPLLMRLLWMCGITPPPAMVACRQGGADSSARVGARRCCCGARGQACALVAAVAP